MIYLRFALCYNDAREYSTTFPVAPDPHDKIFRILPPILFITEQLFLFFSHPAENITMTPPLCIPAACATQQHHNNTASSPTRFTSAWLIRFNSVLYFISSSIQTAGRDLS
jgi:hypothetical protein